MRFAILISLILMLASCNSTQKLLCKTWKVDDVDFGNGGKVGGAIQKQIKQQLTTFKLSFKKDGTYIIDRVDSSVVGKWSFSDDKKMVHTKSSIGNTDEKLLVLSKTKLVFEASNPEKKNSMTFTCSPVKGSK
jgi:hypothetical protein